MENKGLLGVIEDLMEAEMTKKDPIKNPQEEMDDVEEETGEKLEKAPSKDEVGDKHGKDVTVKDAKAAGGDPNKTEINKAPVCNEEEEGEEEEPVSEAEDPNHTKINKAIELKSGSGKVAGKDGKMNVESDESDEDEEPVAEAEEHDDEEEVKEAEDPNHTKINKAIELKSGSGKVAGKDGKMNVEAADEEDDHVEEAKDCDEEDDMEEAAEVVKPVVDGDPKTVSGDPDKEEINKAPVCNEEDEVEESSHEDEDEVKEASDCDEEEEVEEAKIDDNLNLKLAAAAVKGEKEIDVDGKKMPVTMSKDAAQKILDKVKEEEEHDEEETVDEAADEKHDKNSNGIDDKHETKEAKDLDESDDEEDEVKEEEEVEEEDDLEEDFKTKASIIFETAVNEKVNTKVSALQEEFDNKLEEEIATINEKVSEYIDYAVQSWLEENKLEIKYSLRTEISENFIKGLKTLFEENYIEIPEEDISVVDELTETVESFKEQIEEQTSELEAARKEILEFHRQATLDAITEDLTQTQAVKLEKLAEAVEASDIDEFKFKVEALKESYFDEDGNAPLLTEDVLDGMGIEIEEETQAPASAVDVYANFLGRTAQK